MKQRLLDRRFLAGVLTGVVILIVFGALLAFFLSPELLKHRSSFPLEEDIGNSRVLAAIPGDYKNRTNPENPTSDSLVAGKNIFTANCSMCHGISGRGDAPLGQNMFPKAADLTSQKTRDKTDGELFWIIQNGLSFVGMPAFKGIREDQEMWQAINYIRALQKGQAVTDPSPAATATVNVATSIPTTTNPATTAAAGTTAAVATTTVAPTTAAAATTAADADHGKEVFMKWGCNICHGNNAQGDIGPKLANTARPFAFVMSQVRRGSVDMPSFNTTQISDPDLQAIYDWLKSLK